MSATRSHNLVLHATASRADRPIARWPDGPIRFSDSAISRFPDRSADLDPELSLYRPRTLALLRRYLRISSAVGRLPSVIAREVFRAKVSHYRFHTFEESVIFVLDVERALAGLHDDDQQVIARVVFQGHSHDSAARLLGWKRRTVTRSLCEALDRLSELMLARGLLRKM
jgi:DNA-directed RNA polymerase specialized sigma24 family protein